MDFKKETGLKYLDKELQLELLTRLANNHPNTILESALIDGLNLSPESKISNLMYLRGHGLIAGMADVCLTSKGVDFLRKDGLSDIMMVGTVRIHDDSIKALVAGIIDSMDVPEEEKSATKILLSSASDEAMREVIRYLMRLGVGLISEPALTTATAGLDFLKEKLAES